jgi:chromosome segregation ATPase
VHPQELGQQRSTRERLESEAASRDAAAVQARSQFTAVSAERNALSALVDSLKAQLTAKGADLAAQLDAAAALAVDKAAADARARECDRARSRLEFELGQMKEVRG